MRLLCAVFPAVLALPAQAEPISFDSFLRNAARCEMPKDFESFHADVRRKFGNVAGSRASRVRSEVKLRIPDDIRGAIGAAVSSNKGGYTQVIFPVRGIWRGLALREIEFDVGNDNGVHVWSFRFAASPHEVKRVFGADVAAGDQALATDSNEIGVRFSAKIKPDKLPLVRGKPRYGVPFTGAGYYGAWVLNDFWRSVVNTVIVTLSVTVISLTLGTLGGYALARSGHRYAFWILLAALVFRAMPHITLVSGYMLPFFELNIWGHLPTAIIVLVAINQPFTLWMLHSFFLSIPRDLDESAMVDGCSRFEAFRRVVIPVMWPGVITTGLFSFLLGYNDFAVTAMVLSQNNQTMIPKISSFLGSINDAGNVMYAVAAVVSATVPLFMLVLFFQRQIVSGLTAGAVKG